MDLNEERQVTLTVLDIAGLLAAAKTLTVLYDKEESQEEHVSSLISAANKLVAAFGEGMDERKVKELAQFMSNNQRPSSSPWSGLFS